MVTFLNRWDMTVAKNKKHDCILSDKTITISKASIKLKQYSVSNPKSSSKEIG